jgi:hypothetical protein
VQQGNTLGLSNLFGTPEPYFSGTGVGGPPGLSSLCRCDHVNNGNRTHCLQSRHSLSTTQAEGWGHFYATKILNANPAAVAKFRYYKESFSSNWYVLPVFSDVNALDQARWRKNWCNAAETLTELDYMQFLTTLHTQTVNKFSMADMQSVYQRACRDSNGTPQLCTTNITLQWSHPQTGLSQAADAVFAFGSPKSGHFLGQASLTGVNNQ